MVIKRPLRTTKGAIMFSLITHWEQDAQSLGPLKPHGAWVFTDHKLCVLTLRM